MQHSDDLIEGRAGMLAVRTKRPDHTPAGWIILVQGANISGQVGYDLQVPGHADYSFMDALAASAREQSTNLSEVNSAMHQMDQVTQQNAAMVEEMNAAGAGLAQESGRLGELLASFRTGENAASAPVRSAPARVTAAPVRAPAPAARPAAPVSRPAPAARGNAALNKLQQEWTEF